MAFSKKTLKGIFIVAIIVIVIALAVYLFRCDIFSNLNSCVEDPNKSNTPVPQGSPTPKWVDETFPLNIGMFGAKIKALQAALGIAADGKFGSQTKNTIIAKGYAVPLSLTDYNKIVNPAATGGGTNFQTLKNSLGTAGKNFSGGVTAYMAGPNQVYSFNFYTNGRVFIFDSNNKEKAKGTYSDGGKVMSIDNGATYNAGSVTVNMQNIANNLG